MNNDWVFVLVILPLFYVFLNFARFILIFTHKLSHAITALIFTKGDVEIYIGHQIKVSDNSKRTLKFGRLSLFIKPSIFYLNKGGFCVIKDTNITINQDLLILLSGTVVTLFVTIISYYMAFSNNLHGSIKLLLVIFSILAIISLVYNLHPQIYPHNLNNSGSGSDGYQISAHLKNRKYLKAVDLYNEQEYAKSSVLFMALLNKHPNVTQVYRLLTFSLMMIEDYVKANEIASMYLSKYASEWDADDYSNAGLIKSRLNLYEESLFYYSESLRLNPEHIFTLNNRGYTYNLLERYSDGITDFDHAIKLDPNFAYSYCNRGLSKIKIGNVEGGLNDINHSISLDEYNSYAYLNLGIYNLDKNNCKEALSLFEKAKAMDKSTHNVDIYIIEANKRLNNYISY